MLSIFGSMSQERSIFVQYTCGNFSIPEKRKHGSCLKQWAVRTAAAPHCQAQQQCESSLGTPSNSFPSRLRSILPFSDDPLKVIFNTFPYLTSFQDIFYLSVSMANNSSFYCQLPIIHELICESCPTKKIFNCLREAFPPALQILYGDNYFFSTVVAGNGWHMICPVHCDSDSSKHDIVGIYHLLTIL